MDGEVRVGQPHTGEGEHGTIEGVLIVQADGAVTAASASLTELAGGALGAHFAAWLCQADQEPAREAWAAFLRAGAPCRFSATLKHGLAVQLIFSALAPTEGGVIVVRPAPPAPEHSGARLSALYQVGLAIASLDVDEVLRVVHRQLSELMDTSTFYIALYDSETGDIRFSMAYDCGEPLEPFTANAAGTLVGWVVEHQRPVVLYDAHRQEPPVPFSLRGSPMRSIIIVPMSVGRHPVGVLSVQSHEPEAFSDDDVVLVEAVASQTAVAIRNAQLYDETVRHLAALEALHQTSLSLTFSPDPIVALQRVAQTAKDLVGSEWLCVAMTDEQGEPLRRVGIGPTNALFDPASDLPAQQWSGALLSLLDIAGRAAVRDGKPVLAPDVSAHPLFANADTAGVGALAVFPLQRTDRALGVFGAAYDAPRTFRDVDIRLLHLLADQAATALENATNYQETQDRLAEVMVLYDLAKQTTSSLKLEDVLQTVVSTLRQVFSVRGASIALVDERTNELVIHTAAGIEAHWKETARLKVGEGVSAKVAETGESNNVPDTLAEPGFIFFDRSVRSLIAVPLRSHDRVIGTLTLDSNRPHAFTEAHERLLTIAASQVAVAIENAQLYQALQERAEKLQETNAKLEAAYAELQELNNLRNEMVANVTHELRNPLTFLKGYIGLIRDAELGPVTDEQIEALNVINEKTDSVARLISDIMSLERISPATLQLGHHDLNAIVARAVTDAQIVAATEGRQLTIGHELAPGALPVCVDLDRVNQVIGNLVNNAIRFTPDGGTITLVTRSPAEGEQVAQLTVRDTGVGIPADKLPHVFERFYQVDPTAGYRVGGAGLGLAIVQRIVEAHGGKVWAESAPGRGSAFTLTLPIASEYEPPDA